MKRKKKVEAYFFDIRKNLFEYDRVLDTQRDRIYAERRQGLLATDLTAKMEHYVTETMDDILEANLYQVKNKPISEWPLESLAEKIREYCPLMTDLTSSKLEEHCKGSSPLESLRAYLHRRGLDAYYMKRTLINEIDPGLMQRVERYFFLSQIDKFWKNHLQDIKSLQQVIGLRGYAQRDPLTEYKIEGYNLFLDMLSQIRRKVVYCIYSFQPATKMTKYEEQ
eukprot:gnl/TRDRNA2_/TRDRNA2_177029_c1_seq1.p2 gnl/TRDRNA2_/TRDRNA2_177029_c1~~gnl/TRDRNA2_/TRDRNA2_177029_c1_seq1.p2  ORF type:complete len:223 (+),score=7.78 gnl/TRDRNA2_/TRDRNA2_177029_c1_seq1:2151-2819(+)